MSQGTVLVTGASGYIAGFAIKQLIAEDWIVCGTIRDLAKAEAVRATLGLDAGQLKLSAANLTADAGWAEAATRCDYILHIASPLPSGVSKNDDELIVPARDGALRVLRAARDAGVKRVVMTSSTAAICYGVSERRRVFTEADWTDPNHPDTYAYVRSKVIAERAARDFMASEGGAMEFCTINPGLVLGPVLGSDYSGSLAAVQKMLNGDLPGLPHIGFPVCDVRDIAGAHVRAMTQPGLNGERFLCTAETLWLSDIAAVLKIRLGDRAKRVPTLRLPDFLVRLSGLFDPEIKLVLPELGRERICECSHARAVLGWDPRPPAESIVDTARSLIEHGLVKR
jgi:dihydroflavonol-4-reductase